MNTRRRKYLAEHNDSSLAVNLNNMAAHATDTDPTTSPVSGPRSAELSTVGIPGNKDALERSRSSFEEMVQASLQSIMEGQRSMKKDFDHFKSDIIKAVEFQNEEIKELQTDAVSMRSDIKEMKVSLDNAWDSIFGHREQVDSIWEGVNKVERHSRRSNIRIIGVKESDEENVEKIVQEIFSTKFARNDIEVERAHRDGRKIRANAKSNPPRPRHILVKVLRYKDKTDIMRRRRDCLNGEQYHIVEDLTAVDLEDKQRWAEKVRELYQRGTKLRFVGGVWRDRSGKKAPFYDTSDENAKSLDKNKSHRK